MKKRIFAMLLAITMIISMVPVQAFATETEPAEVVEEVIETTAEASEATEEEIEEETTLPEESEESDIPETTFVEEILEESFEAAYAAPSGEVIGSVRVIVENAAFSADDGAPWTGILVDTEVALLDDMTMMTAILTALNENGHTWEGTGGDDPSGWDITYISSISKDGTEALAEFHGGSMSGWMGTLNDWFVNMGFEQWKAGTDLLDGDVIRLMYTLDMGADLGGGWENQNGYLSSLSASAGTLAPAFDKETLEYTLTVESGIASVDITAVAENKQEQVTVTAGGTGYRRGENVAVADGTEISIACGEKTYTVTVSVAAEEECQHQWTDATCKAPKTCSLCGETEGEVGGHSWVDATCKAPKTCSVCSATEGEVGDHSYVDGICSVCGEAEEVLTPFSEKISVPSNGHSTWGNINGLTLSGTDGSIYEAYWSSTANPYVLDVILGQDTALNATITAEFSRGGTVGDTYKPTISGDLTVTLVDGKGTINMHAAAWNNAVFYPNTDWTINLIVDDGSAALRPTYEVTLPTDTVGYTVTAYNSESPVIGGRSFSFKLAVENTYTKGENFKVLVNGEEITGSGDIYTITDINEAKTVTVEGIREKTLAEMNVTVIAPEGSTVSSGRHYSYFKYDFSEPLEETVLEDGRIQKVFPTQNGRQGFIRIQHPKGVTYWDFDGLTAGKVFEITEEMLFIGSEEFTPKTIYPDFEMNIKDKADLYLTVNEKGWLDMATGDTWNLNVFRNFLSLGNTITNDCLALPDTHYQVIDVNGNPSDVVSVTPDANNSCYAEIKAENPGTAIILVTYDAVLNNKGEGGKQWSALWPENTGVIVVTVDGASADFATNMTVNEEANATGKQVIDAEHDILFYVGSKGATYSFKPDAGCSVTVNRSTVGTEMTFGGFTSSGVRTASDGTVTISGLTTGAHVIKVEKDGAAVYQVIRARQVSFELLHSDGTEVTAGSPAQPGEKITVQFHELISPMEKLSGVYNTNFAFRYTGENGEIVQSSSSSGYGVYTFSGSESLQKFTVTIPSYWNENTFALTDGAIRLGGFGSNAGAHRTLTYIAGKEVNTNASGVSGYLSVLPEIVINTIPCGYESYKVTLPTGEGYTVSGGTVPVTEGDSYSFTVTISGGYDGENMVVLVNGEAIEAVDGTYTVENVREDLVITVEGVVKVPAADMTNSTVIFSSSENGTDWGNPGRAYLDTLTLGGAEVVSATWEGNNGSVVLTYDTPANAVVGLAVTFGGRNASWVEASMNGVGMSPNVPVSAKLIDGTATVSITAGYSRYMVTKTLVLSLQETPADVVEAVTTVEGLIDSIELPVDLEDEAAILEAWEAYEALPEKVKEQITNVDILMEAMAELENLKAVKLVSGKSVTLKASLTGKVTWSLAEEYAPYASVTAAGKLTAKKVLEKVSIYAVAADEEENEETVRIDIYPAVSQVKILDEDGTLVNSKTVPVKVNDGSDETYVFRAGTYPADAMGDVTWTVSDKKGAMVTYEISGNEITIQPAENVKKGTVTLTATAADGSKKKATVKLNIAVLVEDISVTTKYDKNLTQDDAGNTIFTVASGTSVTLTAAPTNANATNKAIAWSVVEGGEYASVSTSGKLTAVKNLTGVKYAVVRAAAKDGSGIYTDTKVKITPLALGVQMYCGGRVCTGITRMQNMTAQDTLTLNARVYPLGKANQTVTWSSSNAKIASVTVDENGCATVTCRKAGKVTITATAADGSKEKATFTLNIVQGIESLTLEDQVVAVKKSLKLAKLIQINPAAATNKKLTWTIVGDTFGAKLSSAGVLDTKKVDVSNGPVVLTVSASAQDGWGAEPAVCTVTVYPATTKKMVVMNGEEVVGKKDVLELEVGKTLTLKGFCQGAANVYTWKSNNKNVQVEDGVITASEAAIGKTATITCTAADGTNIKVSVKVKIVAPTVEE